MSKCISNGQPKRKVQWADDIHQRCSKLTLLENVGQPTLSQTESLPLSQWPIPWRNNTPSKFLTRKLLKYDDMPWMYHLKCGIFVEDEDGPPHYTKFNAGGNRTPTQRGASSLAKLHSPPGIPRPIEVFYKEPVISKNICHP